MPLICCVTLNKSLCFSGPELPHLLTKWLPDGPWSADRLRVSGTEWHAGGRAWPGRWSLGFSSFLGAEGHDATGDPKVWVRDPLSIPHRVPRVSGVDLAKSLPFPSDERINTTVTPTVPGNEKVTRSGDRPQSRGAPIRKRGPCKPAQSPSGFIVTSSHTAPLVL